LAPRGAGALPLVQLTAQRPFPADDDHGLSSQLKWEMRAWAGRSRETPAKQLEFLVQAHRLASDMQVELGLGYTVFCVDDDVRGSGPERSRAEAAEDAAWRARPVAQRLEGFPRLSLSRDAYRAPEVVPFVVPDDEGVVGRRIRLSEEWIADFPVWGADYGLYGADRGWVGLLDRSNLPVGPALVSRLAAWNREWELWYPSVTDDGRDGTVQDPVISYETRLGHVVEGHRLAADLQAACGPRMMVIYPASHG
jgi:hypothetical protein